jgi:pantoate--beta-alanine ligase
MSLKLNHPVAFVPTMGALHAGHQSLIEIAKSLENEVVVSIFVNPLQFENPDDFLNYPKTFETDIATAESSGATFIWSPTFEEIYPGDPEIVSAGVTGNLFEGVHRFGHFDGVLTVVKRLFELVQPKYAVFGEKDFQQLFLIKEMVNKLKLPISVISAPTIREDSGLAMSSRNSRLSVNDRASAAGIYSSLIAATAEKEIGRARQLLIKGINSIPGFITDYVEIIDEENFEVASEDTVQSRAIVAGWINGVRLIDNMVMSKEVASK